MAAVLFRSRLFLLLSFGFACVLLFFYNQSFHGRNFFKPKFEGCSLDYVNYEKVDQSDPCLISLIRQHFLMPPSQFDLNLAEPAVENPSMGQAQAVADLLDNKKKGFFVECGALDGETRSNTLYFERFMEWEGILIEADPENLIDLKTKHRKAWSVPACLSTTSYPQVVSFEQKKNMGKISDYKAGNTMPGYHDVQCFPFYSILLALNRTQVDYFSLDVEGAEYPVLKSIPWDKVDIDTLSVEFIHGKEGKEAIRRFMENRGYETVKEITHPQWLANDFIFAKAK